MLVGQGNVNWNALIGKYAALCEMTTQDLFGLCCIETIAFEVREDAYLYACIVTKYNEPHCDAEDSIRCRGEETKGTVMTTVWDNARECLAYASDYAKNLVETDVLQGQDHFYP